MKTYMTALLATLAISACSSDPKLLAPQVPSQSMTADSKQVGAANGSGSVSESAVGSANKTAGLNDASVGVGTLSTQLQKVGSGSVYFDFDKFAIKPEHRETIRQWAEYAKAHENTIITLEGNADERGSSEYNLALGSKRANAVSRALRTFDVPDGRIKTVSLGEERPRLSCHEELCWKENRRVDFVGKPD